MKANPLSKIPTKYIDWGRRIVGILLAVLVTLSISAYAILQTKITAVNGLPENEQAIQTGDIPALEPFPISVDPTNKRIKNPETEEQISNYFQKHVSINQRKRWFDRALAQVSQWGWYQNLATPNSRILVILPGERKEEIADNFTHILDWNEEDRDTFLQTITNAPPAFSEGTFAPGKYVVRENASPQYTASLVKDRFARNILSRYPHKLETQVSLHDALTIASLLERESYQFDEMRIIAGIIWNRLFIDMPLQIDATLQYAKASEDFSTNWWPTPYPNDKYLESPFNTYKNKGLPPAPIANPEPASILAALNPIDTTCLYYFHDKKSNFHCSATYKEHLEKLRKYYGQGK